MGPTTTLTEADATAVREALARILASTLQGSPQLARFLTFVVEETLAGRGDQLKEYAIAVGAFGQPVTFDPATDARVRVAARQLRFRLDEHYRQAGALDPVRIELPKGRYVPRLVTSAARNNPQEPSTPALAGAHTAPPTRWSTLTSRGRLLGLLAILGIGAAALTAREWWSGAAPLERTDRPAVGTARPDAAATPVIAVLPFANLTGRPGEQYIGDGLAEEIASRLAADSSTRVIARTSAWKFKETGADVRQAGRELGATYVVDGSVRRAGDQYRVSVGVDATTDGVRVWSRQYEVGSETVFALYDTIAQSVHDELSVRLGTAPAAWRARRPPPDAKVNALYLEGRYFWNRRTPEAMHQAVALLRDAVRRDSTFAAGWSALGGVYATMEVNHVTEPGVSAPLAIAAARRALALDPSLGEAWTAIGLVTGFSNWDWAASDDAFRRAVALSPGYATARSWYSNTLLARGRVDEAIEQLEQARAIDPLSGPIAYGITQAYYYGRRWEEGLRTVERTIALNPGNPFPLRLKAKLLKGAGRVAEARAIFAELGDSIDLALVGDPAVRGREVRRLLAQIAPADQRKAQFWIATMYAQVGAVDTAFAWLERAFVAHQPDLVSIRTDPMIDPLMGDPRYRAMLSRIGLDDNPAVGLRGSTRPR